MPPVLIVIGIGSNPFHLEQEAVLIRSAKNDAVGVSDRVTFADDDVSKSVLLGGIHRGGSLLGEKFNEGEQGNDSEHHREQSERLQDQ